MLTKIFIYVGVVPLLMTVIIVALLLYFAPRERVRLFWKTALVDVQANTEASPADLKALRQQLIKHERLYSGLKEGAEKEIIFAFPPRPNRSALCVLYLHGFSACRKEMSPVPEQIAQSLNANYFATRLTGHGIDVNSLAQARVNDWIYDTIEAFQVARTLGDKVIVIGTSTGATLATWLAQQEECRPYVAAMILVSPNFGLYHWASSFLIWPMAKYWLPFFLGGEMYHRKPINDESEGYWINEYPVALLCSLGALIYEIKNSDLELIRSPSLFIYSDDDQTVSSERIDQVFRRWGAPIKNRISVNFKGVNNAHIPAGDLINPQNNPLVIEEVVSFVRRYVSID